MERSRELRKKREGMGVHKSKREQMSGKAATEMTSRGLAGPHIDSALIGSERTPESSSTLSLDESF